MRSFLQRGATTVEMTLVGIPLMFIMISIFEIARGMWMYHTIAAAVKEGVRYATVHGENCATAPNSCSITAANVGTVIKNLGVGLDPADTTLTFMSGGSTDISSVTLANCAGASTGACAITWPVVNSPGQTIEIDGIVKFNSALAMFWPGARRISFAVAWFPASSTDVIQF